MHTSPRTTDHSPPAGRRLASRHFWQLAERHGSLNEKERLAAIRAGLGMPLADALKVELGLSTHAMGALLGLSSATYERRRRDGRPLDPIASERLDRVIAVALQAEAVFEDRQAAAAWLAAPNRALDNVSPVMVCETEIGARQVRRILNALEWGGVV